MSVIGLDGGMGVEIAKRYAPVKQGLWSASVLLDRPDIVDDDAPFVYPHGWVQLWLWRRCAYGSNCGAGFGGQSRHRKLY